ncbi:WS/DGAT domain-containing protein [Thalassotalea psychrophila]|uniref:diacylglycerol O-acyltransferase n=1 Tax=Thalassotalea psychrophila TaxID=3065647 RepID=A0ABY9U0A5_9GAMM|nr:WS/DGAT domain-containing protein [Colwelliaceae bacterium SQ149]
MPRQLHSVDRLFLDIENAETSAGITAVYFYDPSGLPNGTFSLDLIVEYLDQIMKTIPVMCGKLYRTPLDLDNPYLVEQQDFHARDHIKHYQMQNSTCMKELSKVTNQYQYAKIDTERPLWDAQIVSGINIKTLPKNAFAIAIKLHHAIADGMTAMDLTAKIHGLKPLGEPVVLPKPEVIEVGGLFGMATRIISSNLNQSIKMLQPLTKVGPQLGVKLMSHAVDSITDRLSAPQPTRFAKPISQDRVWGYTGFELSKLKKMQKVLPSCTLNDLACSIISGGIREYLEYKNETPQDYIKALAPQSTRTQQQQSDAGNEVNIMSLEIPIHIADPLEALVAVNKSSTNKKNDQKKIGPENVSELAKSLPPALLSYLSLLSGKSTIANLVPNALGNIIISNVPGPQMQMNMLGAKMTNFTGIAPIMDGIGAFFAVVSYNGTLNISVSSCAEIIEEPKYFIDCLNRSYERLEAAIENLYQPYLAQQNNEQATLTTSNS